MNVAYASHSLVAKRQELFAKELGSHLQARGHTLHELYPEQWGPHTRDGGHATIHTGNMNDWRFHPVAWSNTEQHDPDVLLLQNEPGSKIVDDALAWANTNNVRVILFTWENQPPLQDKAVHDLQDADYAIYGNTDAKTLARDAGVDTPGRILPQVGIDPMVFSPKPSQKPHDVLFAGRAGDPMKGEHLLDQAAEGHDWTIRRFHEEPFIEYEELPSRYSTCKLQAVPSRDVDGLPREQFAPAVTVEGLLCGVPVVASDQAAVVEWLEGCPAAWHVPQDNAKQLEAEILHRLRLATESPDTWEARCQQGREWAVANLSTVAVANDYVDVIEEVNE